MPRIGQTKVTRRTPDSAGRQAAAGEQRARLEPWQLARFEAQANRGRLVHSDACGILPSTDCDICLERRMQWDKHLEDKRELAADRWEKLCRIFPHMRKAECRPWRLPHQIGPGVLAKLVWGLLQPEYKSVLQAALLMVLEEPILDLTAEMTAIAIEQWEGSKDAD